MQEIPITSEHKLPYGYWYEKPITKSLTRIKSDEEIVEELKDTMPLSEIAKICDSPEYKCIETELRARLDITWDKQTLTISLHPCRHNKQHPILTHQWNVISEIYKTDEITEFTEEKVNKIIYKGI